MNNTEYDNLSKEKLLEMYESLFDYATKLEDRVQQIENNEESYDEGYDDGYASGHQAGYDKCLEDS